MYKYPLISRRNGLQYYYPDKLSPIVEERHSEVFSDYSTDEIDDKSICSKVFLFFIIPFTFFKDLCMSIMTQKPDFD